MQPDYFKCETKINARMENVNIYRKLTGNYSIPKDRTYWTLCNKQPDIEGSEIVQMIASGLIEKRQFHGVDNNEDIIKQNRIWHPDANWYFGDWIEVIEKEDFNPSLIYLDTTSFADYKIASNMTVRTMLICQPQTVLLVNAMLNDPRSSRKFDPAGLIRNLERQVPTLELRMWNKEINNYSYSTTGKTGLVTYVFKKG